MLNRVALALVRAYQFAISPLLAPSCRFHPTCSDYAVGALRKFGIVKASWLIARRIAKCNPWHPGGVDPVP